MLERRNALNGGKHGDLVCRGLHSNGDGVVFHDNIVDPTANEMDCKAADETGVLPPSTPARKKSKKKYDLMCKERGLAFQPLIFETYGFLDKSVFNFHSLAETRAADVPNPIPEFTTRAA